LSSVDSFMWVNNPPAMAAVLVRSAAHWNMPIAV
jgi:hypothetical protein